MDNRILVAWIGHADLRAFASSLPRRDREQLLEVVGQGPESANGPIKTLTDQVGFTEVHLLSNYEAKWNRGFAKWIGSHTRIHRVKLENPTDYTSIFDLANAQLGAIRNERPAKDFELCIHLSPGTPAMAAIWVLLGKTRFPATFYQTHRGKAWQADIPFEITEDLLPELLKTPDAHLQHLAAKSPGEVAGFEAIIGDSKPIRLAVGRAKRMAVRDIPVLILGESGTGKEMFAHAIHEASHRKNKTFIAINCSAIPRELLESELFGYAPGAFTGAKKGKGKSGAFALADGGTLLLDEIGDCDTAMQAKLLRVMQPPLDGGPCDRVYWPVGSEKEQTSNVRIIAATNLDLVAEVNGGRFREDLYYRLATATVVLPALRERRGDILMIAKHLLGQINHDFSGSEPGYNHKSLSVSANQFVKQFDWPGNVRQLYNSLVQAATMSETDVIGRTEIAETVSHAPGGPAQDAMEPPLGDGFRIEKHLEDIQGHILRRAMEEAGGAKTRAARLLGMKNYQTLDAQLKRLKVKWKQ